MLADKSRQYCKFSLMVNQFLVKQLKVDCLRAIFHEQFSDQCQSFLLQSSFHKDLLLIVENDSIFKHHLVLIFLLLVFM